MAISESDCIDAIKSELQSKFDLTEDNAPNTIELISVIVSKVLEEVKNGEVDVDITQLTATTNGGPINGSATGSIS
ncbi:MAG: hypothetical protein LBQ34_03835 [Alphaproteobacteria bacterium]|jgi:hypothetical protein|nr:hypothetical protein [Alphaproteobacteria bacterium]